MGLVLKAVDVAHDRLSWRWLLTGASEADHRVCLDPAAPETRAFTDLHHYLGWHADPDPDRRAESEASIVERLGGWIATHVLGDSICAALAAAAPVSVRVRAPDFLLSTPLELARVGGVPLARRGDISLVYDVGASSFTGTRGDRLRMVAVFSLPTETSALGLRRERYELTRMVRALAAREQRMIDLEVLQYGVTRKGLADRMTRGGGPDVLHLSGHGGGGLVLLETDDGRPDPVSTDELLRLLSPAKGRLRLAVLSACESAAAVTAQTLRLLGFEEAADQAQATADAEAGGGPVRGGIASQVADRLGCAVVAMRYPVIDDFAIALAESFYEGLYSLDLELDAALRRAIPKAAGSVGEHSASLATPVLLGQAAIGMMLAPPRGESVLTEVRLAGFPDEPQRFVGRAGVMARASRALAPASGQSGVLFHGMAGAGKTSCALELAHRHRFAHAVWWRAPERQEEWPQALTYFAQAWEAQIPGFPMVDKLSPPQAFQGFLPRLRTLLRDNGVLLVLDNLETLLTEGGRWRDSRWAELVEALTGHGGESRVVLTSRIRPAGLSATVRVEPVHALSRDEAMLMARELPNLRRLLHTDPGPERLLTSKVDRDRATVRRILRVVQGHPKLLELADAAAADPQILAAHLKDDGREDSLTAFFTHGESTLDAEDFLGTLSAWTRTSMETLPAGSRLLLQLLAGLEAGDRLSWVLEAVWTFLCERVNVEPPDPAAALEPLTAAALVEPQRIRDTAVVRYGLHPGVAEAVRVATPDAVRAAVDTELGDFWYAVAQQAARREGGGEHTALVVRAGLAGAVYLMRRRRWDAAGYLVEQALNRDRTVAVAQVAVAHLRRIAEATGTPKASATLGRAVVRVDPVEGERLLHAAGEKAAAAGDHRLASAVTSDLIDLYRESGRLSQALALADRKAEHIRRAGLGPWTQLGDEARRLQILRLQGQAGQVLAEVRRLRERMARLPDPSDAAEAVRPFHVRGVILNLGAHAAQEVGSWQEALDLNAARLASLHARDAGEHAIAFARFNDYYPLLRLGRLDEADRLLRESQQTFEDHHELPSLAQTLSARADLADERGHHREAVDLQHTALRLLYVRPDPDAIRVSHHNLAIHLAHAGLDPVAQLAHFLAAAVIARLTGQPVNLSGLPNTAPPTTITELAAIVEQVEGVRFTELVVALAGSLEAAQQAFEAVIAA